MKDHEWLLAMENPFELRVFQVFKLQQKVLGCKHPPSAEEGWVGEELCHHLLSHASPVMLDCLAVRPCFYSNASMPDAQSAVYPLAQVASGLPQCLVESCLRCYRFMFGLLVFGLDQHTVTMRWRGCLQGQTQPQQQAAVYTSLQWLSCRLTQRHVCVTDGQPPQHG